MALPVSNLPIISTGITLFIFIVYLFQLKVNDLTGNWALNPTLISQFELSRLTTYPLVHFSPLHLIFNMLSLWPCLASFELAHGSLHTAIVLNTTGAVTGVIYSIISLILQLNPDTYIGGASGWCFTFITVDCLVRAIDSSKVEIYNGVSIPTKSLPFVYLVISQVIVPNASFLGHLIGILVGFLVFGGILGPLCSPPFEIVEKIENWKPFKKLLSLKELFVFEDTPLFVWIYEKDCVDKRYQNKIDILPL